MRKLLVKPTAAQARLLKALHGDPQLSVLETATWRSTRWQHDTGWKKAFAAEKLYGNPRASTIRKCILEEWLTKRDLEAWKSEYILSEWGHEVAEGLDEEDTISRKMGYSARDIIEVLRVRHEFPHWIVAEEVRLGTGGTYYYMQGGAVPMRGSRRIDLFAMSTYRGEKFRRIAYEIKVSRQDFLHELEQPDKRVGAEYFANECYFATPQGLIEPNELPDGWGLVEIGGDFHRMKVRAVKHEAADLHPSFVSSLCRSLVRRA